MDDCVGSFKLQPRRVLSNLKKVNFSHLHLNYKVLLINENKVKMFVF